MANSLKRPPNDDDARIAHYHGLAQQAARKAEFALFPEARVLFLQIAESYERLAASMEDIARKRGPASSD
jgi:hypothetical protein